MGDIVMRSLGKKILINRMNRVAGDKQETRDGILWEILPSQRMCKVKIQGSNEMVYAHYPDNIQSTSRWMKVGTSVKIVHTGGVRGWIEIIGLGQTIPTPVPGESGFPTPSVLSDAIISGCGVVECFNDPRMAVLVKVGTYRIAGTIYTLSPISMLYGDNFKMGDGGKMEQIAGAIAISAPPAVGNFRYDMISVGTDGVIDYTAGIASGSDPLKPSVAPGHIALSYILIYGGMTEVRQFDIGRTWKSPEENQLIVTVADNQLSWNELSTTINVSVRDQYGNPKKTTGYGWYITIEFTHGNGKLYSPEEGESVTKVGGHTGPDSDSYTFTYTRYQQETDISPSFTITLDIEKIIQASTFIILLDSEGNPM
jgi:hypothetical protein